MIVISARDLTKAYGTDVILEGVSFHLNKGDRVGIIGVNGAGKTTLLNALAGETSCDGDVFISGDLKVGFLKQDAGLESENTIREEVDRVFSHFPHMEARMEELLAALQSPEAAQYPILYFYNCIGTKDSMYDIHYNEYYYLVNRVDCLTDGDNAAFTVIKNASHEYRAWGTGLYNFLRVVFAQPEDF